MNPSTRDLPPAFESQMKTMLGDQYDAFRVSLGASPPVSIRLNPLKPCGPAIGEAVTWCKTGRYLDHRPAFTLDPHFHAGAYYVQEASSMFLEQVVKHSVSTNQPLRALDLCAAPGGKSTHLLSLLSRDSLLVSNEVIRSRASVLSENIQKWGYTNVMVTNNDPSAFGALPGFFDLMVIDAPCSGEGLFRKDPDAMAEWSPDSVALCSSRQRRIVQDAWPALSQNGVLIYCTCTYNEAENEKNLAWLGEQHDVEFISIPHQLSGIQEVTSGKAIGYRFFPHHIKGEGFFISAMRKLGLQSSAAERKRRSEKSSVKTPTAWLKGDFVTVQRGELLIAVPASIHQAVDMVSQNLNVVLQGVAMGTMKHGKFVPEHSLSLSTDLNKEEFRALDLTREESIQYLRKDSLNVSAPIKGLALVQYEGLPLGWVNVLDNRINNMYPPAWRIKNL